MVLLVLAALILSGCAASRPVATQTPTPTSTASSVDVFSLKPELVKCQFFGMTFEANASTVSSLLPPGYVVDFPAAAPTVEVLMNVDFCGSIIVNNETVIPNSGLLLLKTRVRVNESLAKGADVQYYALEILATNQTIVNLLHAVGFTATLAEITLQVDGSAGGQSTVRVTVDGNAWYEATSVRWTPFDAPETTLALRHHQVGDPSNVRWLDYVQTEETSSFPGETVLRVDGGTAKKLDWTSTGVISALGWVGVSHGPLAFGKL